MTLKRKTLRKTCGDLMSKTGPGVGEGQRSEEVLEGIDASGSQVKAVLWLTVKRQGEVMSIDLCGNSGELHPELRA